MSCANAAPFESLCILLTFLCGISSYIFDCRGVDGILPLNQAFRLPKYTLTCVYSFAHLPVLFAVLTTADAARTSLLAHQSSKPSLPRRP